MHIFGASGSGVTTLGNALAEQLHLPYLDSDTFFWEPSSPPFTIRRNPINRNEMVQESLQQTDSWILGGSIINWGENVFPNFDLIIFLWLPPAIRLERLKTREVERYGEVVYTDPERNKLFNDFMAWAEDYDQATGLANRTLKAHEAWLDKQDVPILELRGNYDLLQKIELIKQEIANL